MPDGLSIDAATERLFHRRAQEAIRNVHKPADARTAEIGLHMSENRIRLEVCDDGAGAPATRRSGADRKGISAYGCCRT